MRHTLHSDRPFVRSFVLAGGVALIAAQLFTHSAAAQSNREPPAREQDRTPHSSPPAAKPQPRKAEPPRSAAPGAKQPGAIAKKKSPPPDTFEAREKTLSNLYAHLATAEPGEAAGIAVAIEALWVQSGSDTVSLLLTRATQATLEKKTELARDLFDAIVDLAPDFAEGFARRAFFHYQQNDPTRALGDLRRTLALEPNHFRALDGLSTILSDIGEKRASLKALQQLELVHPNWPGLAEDLKEMERAVEGQGI